MTQTTDFIKSQVFSPVFDLQKQYANYKGILKGAVQGKVVTRFPPQPSGYLHIGHIKAALLNYHYAKMYSGKMILRFDDTNPSKQKMQFVDSIIADLYAMGIKHDRLTYTSDYFQQILQYGRFLIKKDLAYCDNTPVQVMRQQRGKKIQSKNRSLTIQQNLAIFQRMIKGQQDQYTLRAKIDMKSNNGCMRDPVLFRTQKLPHHRTGTKYSLYPTYDFACPIVDSVQGVTHVLRTNQYADRIPQYKWILKALQFPDLQIYQYSRLNLQYTVLSKRKLQQFVDTNKVTGWDDPRFPTFRGVIKKGIRVQTLIQFMLQQGPSKNTNLMQWQKMWAINKRIIDPICPRYFAVSLQKISQIFITNANVQPQAATVILNPINQALGTRPIWRGAQVYIQFQDALQIKQNQKITLMKWGNVLIKTKQTRADGSYYFTGEYLPQDKDFKKTKKYSWLAKKANLVKADLVEYDHLIKVPKIQQNVNFQDIVNANSRFPCPCYVDPMIRTLNMDDFLQFERRGFYKVANIKQVNGDTQYQFIFTPDGKTKGLASITKQTDKKGDIKKKNLQQKIKQKEKKVQVKGGDQTAQQTKQQKKQKKQREKKQKKAKKQAKQGNEAPVQVVGQNKAVVNTQVTQVGQVPVVNNDTK